MISINKVPILNTENHKEWIRKVNLAFVCVELDWVLKEPKPVQPPKPMRDEKLMMLHGKRKEGIMPPW
jgi:hypothetical protein